MSNGLTDTDKTSQLKDITQISKTDFLNLPLTEQMKYVDQNKLNAMVSSNKTRNYLTVEYGSNVADQIMSLDVSDKDKIKLAKNYESVNQKDMNAGYNSVYSSLHDGTGFYPLGDQEPYAGLTSEDFYEKFSPLLPTFNTNESATFYKMYSDLQKYETSKYKEEVDIAKDLDTVNKEFHSDVADHFTLIGDLNVVNDKLTTIIWTTESLFGGEAGDQTVINDLIGELEQKLTSDLGIYANKDTAAFLNKEDGTYHIPNMTSMKDYEALLDRIIDDPEFTLPTGTNAIDYAAIFASQGMDSELLGEFESGNTDRAKLAWKKTMLTEIMDGRKLLYGKIPIALVDNDEFNKILKEDWKQNFQGTEHDPFEKYKVEK